jgi:hypothetical protein
MKPKCEDCRFFFKEKKAHKADCRRNPPQMGSYDYNSGYESDNEVVCEPIFPWVEPDMWCGEFKPK